MIQTGLNGLPRGMPTVRILREDSFQALHKKFTESGPIFATAPTPTNSREGSEEHEMTYYFIYKNVCYAYTEIRDVDSRMLMEVQRKKRVIERITDGIVREK